MKTWNDLSIREKSAMMRTAIKNGITTLPEIKKVYNEFAEGGPEKIYENPTFSEVTIYPSQEDRQVVKTMKNIFPEKEDRINVYKGIQNELDYLNLYNQSMNGALSKLQELHYASGNPKVTIQRSFANIFPPSNLNDTFERNRPNYINYGLFGDTIYLPGGVNLEHYVAELSHATQFRHPVVTKDFKYLKGKFKPEAYYTPGTTEYNAHRIIEPAIMDYVFNNPDTGEEAFINSIIASEMNPGPSSAIAKKALKKRKEYDAELRERLDNYYSQIEESKGDALNKFAMGGPENDLVDRVIQEEGFLAKPTNIGDGKMTLGSGLTASKWHKLYNQKGEWTEEDNQKAVAEELEERRKWAEKDVPNWDKLPQDSQNALLSYKYNFDFNRKNSPKLYKALSEGDYEEAARQINATSKNPKFKKGLMARRQREQEWFLKGLEQVAQEAEAPIEQIVENASVYNPPQSVINNIIANNGKYMITGTPPLAGTKVPVSGIADGLAMQDRMAKIWQWIKDFDMLNGLIP